MKFSTGTTVALLATLALAGCGSAGYSDQTAASSPAASVESRARESTGDSAKAEAGFVPASNQTVDAPKRAVIRQGSLAVRVGDLEKSERAAGTIIAGLGGYVDSASSSDLAGQKPILTLSARIPESAFDQALREFEALGTRLSKHVSSQDVTGDLADYAARLTTMRANEESLRNMLRKASDSTTIMEAQRRLAEARGEIEGLQARLASLKGQAALSTIELRLEQSAETAGTKDPRWGAEAWAAASASAMDTFRIVLGAFLWFVAYSPLWIVGYLVVRFLRGRKRPTSNAAV
ncbi:MAG: DUF4349 domain-containing protein [Fimbriimonadaceae bacterium]|nr:DUF4349 domain-containing protein [Fimbriimonadaceae bacterium]